MAVTIKDIAAATGLSKPTVAWILRDAKAPYKAATCELVWSTARELGYRPNAAARAISSGRFGCVVLILGVDPGRSYMPLATIETVQEHLALREMHLTLARLPDEALTESGFVPKVLRQNMADGMIINYTSDIPPRMMELLRQSHAPAVWLNTKLARDCVRPDDFGAGQEAVLKLQALGHRRIAFVSMADVETEDRHHYSFEDRREGYLSAMQQGGLQPIVLERSLSLGEHQAEMQQLLRGPDAPTAVVAAELGEASTAIVTAIVEGRRVPRHLSVIALCRQWKPAVAGLRVSTLLVPAREVAKRATYMLLQKIEAPQTPTPASSVPFIWMEGDTTGPVSAGGE